MSFCPCNSIDLTTSGGVKCAGSAEISGGQPHIEGGVACGGSALVDLAGDAWDGMAGVWMLDEDGGPYLDRTRNMLDGIGGDGTAKYTPTLAADGVFCQPSQDFDGSNDRIVITPDSIRAAQGFTVSLWAKPKAHFRNRAYFSRGVFVLGISYVNRLWAQVQTTNGTADTTHQSHSTAKLVKNKFVHLAATWTPNGRLRTYVNGVLDGTSQNDTDAEMVLSNALYIGEWNDSGWPTAQIMDVRLHPVVRTAEWLKAEYDNYCSPTFYSIGGAAGPTGV